jgi:ABC-2 type transport system permease protein
LTALFNLVMNLFAVLAFTLANGISPALSWLWMLPIILGFVFLASGVGMLLSALYVRFRDVKPIWDVLGQILFYASPIMYIASKYHSLEHYAMLSPLAVMLTQMGHAFIHPARVAISVGGHPAVVAGKVVTLGSHIVYTQEMPSASHDAGGELHVLVSILLIMIVFAFGLWVFTREAPRVAEHL